jgi:hypothetical protein
MDVLLSSDKPRATSPRLGVNDARLDCLKKSRDAQKECLDHDQSPIGRSREDDIRRLDRQQNNFAG